MNAILPTGGYTQDVVSGNKRIPVMTNASSHKIKFTSVYFIFYFQLLIKISAELSGEKFSLVRTGRRKTKHNILCRHSTASAHLIHALSTARSQLNTRPTMSELNVRHPIRPLI
jgi:hypothetical protein